MRRVRPLLLLPAVALLAGGLAGCRQDMHDQPKFKAYRENVFFADQRSARPLVEGVVARGHLDEDPVFYQGVSGGAPVAANPLGIDATVLARGQQRYNIYCAPCHDQTGSGEGMIVQRGYKQPPSFHEDRLRAMPDGYFFQVQTNGFGTMPSYRTQVSAHDRWAIVAYIRALQFSQHATLADVPPQERATLDGAP